VPNSDRLNREVYLLSLGVLTTLRDQGIDAPYVESRAFCSSYSFIALRSRNSAGHEGALKMRCADGSDLPVR